MTSLLERKKVDRSNDHKYEDPILLPHHKIFLSHSGAQKEEFVEQLCVDLERRHRFPFFDKQPSSLPKGERFPALIKAAVAQCEMMVVVVSEEYFTSKWPMIELHGFMQASMKNSKLKILPLFFGLNVDEFSNALRQERWFEVWEEMAQVDDRIKVDDWKQSLKLIVPFNGLVYDRDSKEVVAYRKEIVSNICKSIPLDIKYDESHVQGRSKLCQVVCQHLKNIEDSIKIPGVCVVGLYGVGGIGKTQLCKIMCNELDEAFDGRVCHVELGRESEHELAKKVLTTLTNTSVEVLQEVSKDKYRDVLLNDMIWKHKTFLTIDNVWDDYGILEQAKLYLRAPFVEGSWVIVTSRLTKTLTSLNIDANAWFEMPELEKVDALNMFLYYAANGKKYKNTEDVYAIEECIKSCYFGKGEGRGFHYHPLSLKALGVFLQYGGKGGPSFWVKDLQKLEESSCLREPKNHVFTILRSNFDRLTTREQDFFMDVCLYDFSKGFQGLFNKLFERLYTGGYEAKYDLLSAFALSAVDDLWNSANFNLMEWLCFVHNKEKEVIEDWLQHLVDNALLEDADMDSGKVIIHDLYRKFATLESQGKLVALDMKKRRWVYAMDALSTELEEEPRGCWESLTRICILESRYFKKCNTIWTIEWRYCTKLVVLKLHLHQLIGVLNLKGLICLRSLDVKIRDSRTFDSFKGLEGLKNLTFLELACRQPCKETLIFSKMFCILPFKRYRTEYRRPNVGQLPATLKAMDVRGVGLFERNVLAMCTNLFASELGSSLRRLKIERCRELVQVCGLDRLVGLQSLRLERTLSKLPSLSGLKRLHTLHCSLMHIDEVPGLDGLVGLKSLTLSDCHRLSKLPSLTGLQCLRTLDISALGISEIPNLHGLNQLESIHAAFNSHLTSLQGLGDLPALKGLDLKQSTSLRRLSDISKLTNLKHLELCNTGVELHEEDIRMLEGLQQLEPLEAETYKHPCWLEYKLDFQRHKILYRYYVNSKEDPGSRWLTWMQSGWEEKDLHYPSAAGYPVEMGYKIRDVEFIWKHILGPATKFIGTGGKHKDRAAFLKFGEYKRKPRGFLPTINEIVSPHRRTGEGLLKLAALLAISIWLLYLAAGVK